MRTEFSELPCRLTAYGLRPPLVRGVAAPLEGGVAQMNIHHLQRVHLALRLHLCLFTLPPPGLVEEGEGREHSDSSHRSHVDPPMGSWRTAFARMFHVHDLGGLHGICAACGTRHGII